MSDTVHVPYQAHIRLCHCQCFLTFAALPGKCGQAILRVFIVRIGREEGWEGRAWGGKRVGWGGMSMEWEEGRVGRGLELKKDKCSGFPN